MKIYWTKYCLTSGIIELDVNQTEWDKSIYESDEYRSVYFSENNKKDWYKTKDEALEHSELMRGRKITSIRKQLEKIENVNFKDQLGIS